MTESQRDLGRRWFDEVWNQGRREAIAEMFSSDGVLHDGASTTTGPEAFYEFYDRIMDTFPDTDITVEDTFAEGDKLCVRWSCTGTHTGHGLGMPPTGKRVRVTGISIMRITGSHIVEAWQNWDMLGLLEQMQGREPSPTYIAEVSQTAMT